MNHKEIKSICKCGRTMDSATEALGRDVMPDNGDVSLCIYCGTVLIFEDTHFRPITRVEFSGLPKDVIDMLDLARKALKNIKE